MQPNFARLAPIFALFAGAAAAVAVTVWSPAAHAQQAGAALAPAAAVAPQTIQNGDQVVTVPAGCNAVTQANGQLVILCPSPAQPAAPPAAPPAPGAPAAQPGYTPAATMNSGMPMTRDNWYGWQVLIADGSWLIVGPALASSKSTAGLGGTIALGGYFLGGPIVHLAHGQSGKAAASLGLRAGLPTAGLLVGAALGAGVGRNGDGDFYGALAGAVIGTALGVVTAVVVDVAVLANEQQPITAPVTPLASRRPKAHPAFRIFPTANVGMQQQTVGVQGSF